MDIKQAIQQIKEGKQPEEVVDRVVAEHSSPKYPVYQIEKILQASKRYDVHAESALHKITLTMFKSNYPEALVNSESLVTETEKLISKLQGIIATANSENKKIRQAIQNK